MKRELYKMIHKKYDTAVLFLLLIPAIFGVGYFLNLPYIMGGDKIADSALGYCAQMQQTMKYFYFLVVIFLGCEVFAGEKECGQLATLLAHERPRRKVLLQKYFAICMLITIFHIVFWVFNSCVYYVCNIKNHMTMQLLDKNVIRYAVIFFGYLGSFLVCIAATFLLGIFIKKIYCLVLIYFLWFILRYVDKIRSIKNISLEFMADYLSNKSKLVLSQIYVSVVVDVLIVIFTVGVALYFFEKKDIK